MNVRVFKYHGCGNDFIMLREEEADQIEDLHDFIIQVCDRHTGIGADGLIIARTYPFFMEYYNQDGSRAPMCGNGIRCLSAFLMDQGLIDGNHPVKIQTLAGEKTVEILSKHPFLVRVAMGNAIDDPAAIDVLVEEPVRDYPLELADGIQNIDSFFMSTTHTVVFDEDAMGEIEARGKEICMHPFFTRQTNVNFVNVLSPSHIEVQTYERGCGVTLACGTGVCASALDCYRKGLCGPSIDVTLKAGQLHIDIDENESVWMSGPAKKIMEGLYSFEPVIR